MFVWGGGGSAGPAAAVADRLQSEHAHAHTQQVMFQSGVAVTDGVPGSALCPQISVFYRASPRHKLKIVKVSRQEVQFMKQEKLNKRDLFEARTAF